MNGSAGLMRELGYEQFGAHGGDIGSYIVHRLALDYPERLLGVHVTYPAEPPVPAVGQLSPAELEFIAERPVNGERGGGYAHIQRTRPLTLAYGLTDSPLGLAAWILDKWREWTDCGGDLSTRFTHDELLTLVTLYWVTGTIGSSFTFYRDWGLGAPAPLVDELYPLCPTGVEPRPLQDHRIPVLAAIASAYIRFPERLAASAYANLRQITGFPQADTSSPTKSLSSSPRTYDSSSDACGRPSLAKCLGEWPRTSDQPVARSGLDQRDRWAASAAPRLSQTALVLGLRAPEHAAEGEAADVRAMCWDATRLADRGRERCSILR